MFNESVFTRPKQLNGFSTIECKEMLIGRRLFHPVETGVDIISKKELKSCIYKPDMDIHSVLNIHKHVIVVVN